MFFMQRCVPNYNGLEVPLLEDISIKDFALINSASIDFLSGFTVFSGETGAGKSILIGAISFLLGGKAGPELIRDGTSEARVTGTLFIPSTRKVALQWLSDHAIQSDEGRILLRRIIRESGKSAAWIQDSPVTKAELAEFTSFFVDIHGQHEHQSLMKVSEHRRYLDSYAGISGDVEEFTQLYTTLVEKREIISRMNTSESQRKQKIEMLEFACSEILEANIKEHEDEELESEESRLSQFEKLNEAVETVNTLLSSQDASVVGLLKKLCSVSDQASSLDKSLESLSSRIENAFYELSDVSDEIRTYKMSLVYDPSRLEEVQERLGFLFKLKKKYASNQNAAISEVLDYYENSKVQLEQLAGWETNKSGITKEILELEKDLFTRAKKLSLSRHNAAQKMSLLVEEILSELGMKGTKFFVNITEKESTDIIQKCGPYGMDNIEFLISANAGASLRPLAKIASGGEISRVMLALKTILSSSDEVSTLIFDEIDTGIGGEVSVAVGKHLKQLAQNKQILCITHLASIAVYADTQLRIEKEIEGGKTFTRVKKISGQERVTEIARMLSGDVVSEASIEHARALLSSCS